MGQSRSNPNSNQYTGPLPDVVPAADVAWIVEPNADFKKRYEEMRAAGVDGPVKITEFERDVVLYVRAIWGVPIHTIREVQTSAHAMKELARMPLVEFKKIHKANFEKNGMAHAASTIVIPEETPIIDS